MSQRVIVGHISHNESWMVRHALMIMNYYLQQCMCDLHLGLSVHVPTTVLEGTIYIGIWILTAVMNLSLFICLYYGIIKGRTLLSALTFHISSFTISVCRG